MEGALVKGSGHHNSSSSQSSFVLNGKPAPSSSTTPQSSSLLLTTTPPRSAVSYWTCSKLCAVCFVAGVVFGYTLRGRVRRWASKILRKLG